MGFFKDFKDDLNDAANELENIKDDIALDDSVMVNTLDEATDPDLAELAANLVADIDVQEEPKEVSSYAAADTYYQEPVYEDPNQVSDEVALITPGLVVNGNLESNGSIDVLGRIIGNVNCRGKLTVTGDIIGDAQASEIYANNARIDGSIAATGTVKVGQGTVIVGNISGTSAVIAGAVKGDIDVHGPVIVDSTAVIVGDIKSKSVQINNGAAIDGRCSQCYADIDPAKIFDFNR